jgi:hypothetical protein
MLGGFGLKSEPHLYTLFMHSVFVNMLSSLLRRGGQPHSNMTARLSATLATLVRGSMLEARDRVAKTRGGEELGDWDWLGRHVTRDKTGLVLGDGFESWTGNGGRAVG